MKLYLVLMIFGFVSCVDGINSRKNDEIEESPTATSSTSTSSPSSTTTSSTSSSPQTSSSSSSVSLSSSSSTSISQVITGTVKFERVPVDEEGKLDYNNISLVPLKHATIKAYIPTSDTLLTSTQLDENGQYSLTITQETTVKLIVFAESSEYNIKVIDNSNSDKLYEFKSSTFNPFHDSNFNINIPSGWIGDRVSGRYGGEKYAAPFAILDTILLGCKTLQDNHIKLSISETEYCSSELNINWSDSNTSSYYNPVDNDIFVASNEGTNIDEFDQHVILAEFMKHILSTYSRNDSLGGTHNSTMTLAPEQAFTEGFSQALAGIILNDEYFVDTNGARSQSNSKFYSLEYETFQIVTGKDTQIHSAFNELTIREIIWDLWDNNNTGYDKSSIDLEKLLLAIKTSDFTQNHALATIYSYANNLVGHYAYYEKDIRDLLTARGINLVDDFGTDETNNVNNTANINLYKTIEVDAPALTQDFAGNDYLFNEDKNVRRFRFSTDASNVLQYQIDVNSGATDVIVEIYDNGELASSADDNPSSASNSHSIRICDSLLDVDDEYIIRVYQSPTSTSTSFNATVSVTAVPGTCI